MIAILNVTPDGGPATGLNQYELRINRTVICTFEHERSYSGLARCLRDAADAVDVKRQEKIDEYEKRLFDTPDE